MIKHSTVIKRILKDGWRPALEGATFMSFVLGAGYIAERFFDLEWYTVSQSVFILALFIWGLKSLYDWKKSEIQYEQEKMLRDLGKKND